MNNEIAIAMGEIINRYNLGFHEGWPDVVNSIIDLQNARNLDEITLKILSLALEGYSFREIGKMLSMSHNTAIRKLKELVEE